MFNPVSYIITIVIPFRVHPWYSNGDCLKEKQILHVSYNVSGGTNHKDKKCNENLQLRGQTQFGEQCTEILVKQRAGLMNVMHWLKDC